MGEMLKFGTVGVVAFVIDLGGYNLLVFGPHLMGLLGEGEDTGALHGKPLTAPDPSVWLSVTEGVSDVRVLP